MARNNIRWEIQGGDLTARVLRGLTPELRKQALETALFQAAGVMVKEIKASAPVSGVQRPRSRRLRGGGLVKYGEKPLRDSIIRRRSKKGEAPAVFIGRGKAFWGSFLESGWNLTRRVKGQGNKVLRAIAPRPWFTPAVNRATPAAVARFNVVIQQALIDAAKRLGGAVGLANATRLRAGRR
jgi:hypothetical protein